MSDSTASLQAIFTVIDRLLRLKLEESGMTDTPFVMIAISPDDELILRGNLDPAELKMLSEALAEAAEQAVTGPANDEQLH